MDHALATDEVYDIFRFISDVQKSAPEAPNRAEQDESLAFDPLKEAKSTRPSKAQRIGLRADAFKN